MYAFADDFNSAVNTQSPLTSFIPLIFIFIIFYLLLIRPHNKKMKKHKEMLNSIKKGDKVVTSGGLIGVVNKIDSVNSILFIRIANDIDVKVVTSSVTEILSKSNKTGKNSSKKEESDLNESKNKTNKEENKNIKSDLVNEEEK